MTSAAVSTFVSNNWPAPAVATHCGIVYCSPTFEDFSINCTTCSQEFNLLSCNIFIKHIKECLSTGFPIPGSLLDTVSNNSIEDVFTSSVKCDNAESPEAHFDPLLLMKAEIELLGFQEELGKEADYLSDYNDEDDLSISNGARRKMLIEIIKEYKKHPLLWDVNLSKSARVAEKAVHYNQIGKVVNAKLRTHFTDIEFRRQISRLRCSYRRALKEKEEHGCTAQLWYFEKMHFIMGTIDDLKEEVSHEEPPDSDDEENEGPNLYQLSDRNVILDTIAQYRNYSTLWDPLAPMYKDLAERVNCLRKIAHFINDKYNLSITEKEISGKIDCLRSGYRRASNLNRKFNKPIVLWYYDRLSFVFEKKTDNVGDDCQAAKEGTADEAAINQLKTEPEYFAESQDNETFDYDEKSESDNNADDAESSNAGEDASTATIVLTLISEYKKYPCLWDYDLCNSSSRSTRDSAFQSITKAVNARFNKNFTDTAIRQKIVQLRGNYRRVLRNKEAYERDNPNATENFPISLHYFDQLSFIGRNSSDAQIASTRHSKEQYGQATTEDDSQMSVDINQEINSKSPGGNKKPYKGLLKENCELLTFIIEEYKKQTCLWSLKHYKKNNSVRRAAYAKMATAINDKFETEFTADNLSTEICSLRSSYLRMLRKKREDPNYKTTMWCAGILSFIENSDEADTEVVQDGDARSDDNSLAKNDSKKKCKERFQSRCNIQSKKYVYAIIKLYENAPVLWDTNHRWYLVRNERRKAFEAIVSTLREEHNCQLTSIQLRHRLDYLKKCYFRALHNEVASKPFFYDQMSFLEPFAKRSTDHAENADMETTSCEEFTYLTENRPLMVKFIRMYKNLSCLWEQKGTTDPSAQSKAYDKILRMLAKNDIVLTTEQVLSAINFLHATVATTQEAIERDSDDDKKAERVWFYKYLSFLGRVPRVDDKYCSHCSTHFRTALEYEKHKIELGDSPYRCTLCNKGCTTRNILNYHMKTHKKPIKCDQCDFQAYEKHGFRVHMNRHLGITPYQCELCERGFVTSSELTRHLLTHTGEKPVVCEICGKTFPTNAMLNQHMKRHLNRRDHKCKVCGYAFYSMEALQNHMAGHTDERKHVCEICGASFNRKMTLRQHKTLHDEQKKHACKICGKRFAQKAGLYSHMKSHNVFVNKI